MGAHKGATNARRAKALLHLLRYLRRDSYWNWAPEAVALHFGQQQ